MYDRGKSQAAPLNETSHNPPAPHAREIYMDEMLEGHAIQGKEFHASLFPKVRISLSPFGAAMWLLIAATWTV